MDKAFHIIVAETPIIMSEAPSSNEGA
jgi:hypothetical protein